ncbi:hypothetical protein [Hymenobacter sediminis]|uniref:hypothetical protein n=1 Tax=Hymenobacter sediminis TaxID=2218621 RepID=UPI001EE3DDD7|nr:hypothetical protein [Hymenobacter sediminis]
MKQDKSWLITTEVLSRYLLKQGVKPTSALLSFQENYSGLILTIQNNKGATFKANLFSSLDIVFNRDEDVSKVGGRYIFECGEHSTAQFNFYITDKGEVCT